VIFLALNNDAITMSNHFLGSNRFLKCWMALNFCLIRLNFLNFFMSDEFCGKKVGDDYSHEDLK
jgi:hypothetical protein